MDQPRPVFPTRAPTWFNRRETLLAFSLGVAAMAYIQSGTYEPSGRDGFYHIKMAVLLPDIGFPEHFHWLRHTILNNKNVSHHHGFHILMMPFVFGSKWVADHAPAWLHEWAGAKSDIARLQNFKIGLRSWLDSPYILGGKVLNVVLFGLIFLFADLIMRRLDVGLRWFWLLGMLALPTDFFLRMSYIRAPTASLLILLTVIHCCITGRYVWVGILGVIYCHVYGGFVFYPIVIAVVIACLGGVGGAWRDGLRIAVYSILGSLIGVLTHPYFPQNIAFFKVQLFATGLQTAAVEKIGVGTEWKPFNLDYWLEISAFTLVVFVASLVLRGSHKRLLQPFTLALLVLNAIFLAFCLWKRRFIEYWPMFALLSAASFWQGFDYCQSIAAIQGRFSADRKLRRALIGKAPLLLGLITIGIACFTLHASHVGASCKFDIPQIRRAMGFLEKNTPAGSLIFPDDWDDFPMYFYYNHHNDYVCGLDPQFTNSMDPQLWERYCVITQGRAPKKSIIRNQVFHVRLDDIATHFQADYVIVNKDHQPFYAQLVSRPDLFKLIYPLEHAIRPPKRISSISIFAVLRETEQAAPQ